MTDLIICDTVGTDPLFAGYISFLEKKKWPPALLHALVSERYDA